MTITFFGQLKDMTQHQHIELNDINDTDELQQHLYSSYPALQNQKFVIAVNKNITKEKTTLNNDAEIALLPPFSGG